MNKRKVLIRFDDICPTMNWEQWNKAKQMLDVAGVTALLGVVPECKDPELTIDEPQVDFWDYIRYLHSQGFAIAMHGVNHVFSVKANGVVTRNKISEFAGLPYEEQFKKIKRGKEILNNHGIDTDIFFAPAHSFDDNTLRALKACGFHYVSDGYSSKPYLRQGIIMLPCRSGGIPRIKKCDGYITAVIHAHEWVSEDRKEEYNRFVNLLHNYSDDIVPFSQFSKWQLGNALVQRIIEQMYLFARLVSSTLIYRLGRVKTNV